MKNNKDNIRRFLNPSDASKDYFCPKQKDTMIFENHLNSVMLVFIG